MEPANGVRKYIAGGIILLVLGLAGGLGTGYVIWGNGLFSQYTEMYEDECNVIGINVHGDIYTYIPNGNWSDPDETGQQEVLDDAVGSEDVVAQIMEASRDSSILGIILEIDSYGGLPVTGEEIATALERAGKPSVAVIRQTGASAAYWAASGADHIIASKNSDVGGIGVTMSYLEPLDQKGRYIDLSSGRFKDIGNPDKMITQEERTLLLRDVKITHENFIEAIAKNRGLSLESVRALADGSTMLGMQAKDVGLIDEIGSWNEAKEWMSERIGKEAVVCW